MGHKVHLKHKLKIKMILNERRESLPFTFDSGLIEFLTM